MDKPSSTHSLGTTGKTTPYFTDSPMLMLGVSRLDLIGLGKLHLLLLLMWYGHQIDFRKEGKVRLYFFVHPLNLL